MQQSIFFGSIGQDRWPLALALWSSMDPYPLHMAFFCPQNSSLLLCRSTLEYIDNFNERIGAFFAIQDFHGLDFTCAELDCRKQNMERMIVDQVFPSQVVGPATASTIDFTTISVAGLDKYAPSESSCPHVIFSLLKQTLQSVKRWRVLTPEALSATAPGALGAAGKATAG